MDDVKTLTQEGWVVRRCHSQHEVDEWRRYAKRAARRERLLVRTGITNADSLVVWALVLDRY